MRTVQDESAVRLYHLDGDGGTATTLLYGTLAAALTAAAQQPEDVQDELFLQTRDDVVAYRDIA